MKQRQAHHRAEMRKRSAPRRRTREVAGWRIPPAPLQPPALPLPDPAGVRHDRGGRLAEHPAGAADLGRIEGADHRAQFDAFADVIRSARNERDAMRARFLTLSRWAPENRRCRLRRGLGAAAAGPDRRGNQPSGASALLGCGDFGMLIVHEGLLLRARHLRRTFAASFSRLAGVTAGWALHRWRIARRAYLAGWSALRR